MSKPGVIRRERQITKATSSLFWCANYQQTWSLILGYVGRFIAWTANIILVPLYVSYGLQAILTRHFELVTHYSLTVLGLVLIFAVFISIGEWAIIKNAIAGSDFIQRYVFNNYLSKDYEFYSDAFYGSLAAQATQLRDSYNLWGKLVTLDIPRQGLTIVASLAVIAFKAPVLALITLICMVLVLSITIATSRWRLKWRREVSRASSEMSGVIGDSLTHSTTVKSFGAEKYEEGLLSKSLGDWTRAQYKGWISAIPAVVGRNIFAAITIATLLLVTGKMYQQGSISIAVVALVQLYVIRMITATQEISEIIRDYEGAMGSSYQPVKTILIKSSILDRPDPKILTDNAGNLDIKFNNVSYGYGESDKKSLAIKNFSLHISPGEKVGIVGYSGSGKTTLTKLLLRFIDVTGGSIELGGIDIRDVEQVGLRNAISYVPQEPLLFHRSIGENIAYGKPSAKNDSVLAASRTANVDEFVKELPEAYDTLVGERGIKLSGGQRQRVAIARAVLKDSPILVLDEATSALDSESEKYIQKALWNLMEDRTALVIAHRLSTIRRMDRIVVMNKGSIVQEGTHEQLLAEKDGIYARLWNHQSDGYIVEDS